MKRILQLLEMVGLKERMNENVFGYSKGMRRKLAIARSMIHDPEIILLDEPTSGLDPESQRMVRDVLTELSKGEGMTVFLSSHNLDEVQKICKKVAVIKAGVLRAYDTVENLRSTGDKKEIVIVTSNGAEAERRFRYLVE